MSVSLYDCGPRWSIMYLRVTKRLQRVLSQPLEHSHTLFIAWLALGHVIYSIKFQAFECESRKIWHCGSVKRVWGLLGVCCSKHTSSCNFKATCRPAHHVLVNLFSEAQVLHLIRSI